MQVKTSITSPIDVAWLPAPTPGKVGLTFAPGKHDDSKSSDVRWERDLRMDLARLVEYHRVGSPFPMAACSPPQPPCARW